VAKSPDKLECFAWTSIKAQQQFTKQQPAKRQLTKKLNYYLASHHLAMTPQFSAKDQFYCFVYYIT
jgi:hypothetical protein